MSDLSPKATRNIVIGGTIVATGMFVIATTDLVRNARMPLMIVVMVFLAVALLLGLRYGRGGD